MICVTLFAHLRETHGHVFRTRFRVLFFSRNAQKRATKSDTSTSGHCLVRSFTADHRIHIHLRPAPPRLPQRRDEPQQAVSVAFSSRNLPTIKVKRPCPRLREASDARL